MQELLAGGADQRKRGTDGSELTLTRKDAEYDAVHRRADLDRRLVGLNLHDRLVLRHLVALVYEPARDLAFDEALAQVRQRERVRHGCQGSGRLRRWP